MRPDHFGRLRGPWKASLQHAIRLNTLPVLSPKFPLQTWMCNVEGTRLLMLEINQTRGQNRGRKAGEGAGKGTYAGVF